MEHLSYKERMGELGLLWGDLVVASSTSKKQQKTMEMEGLE